MPDTKSEPEEITATMDAPKTGARGDDLPPGTDEHSEEYKSSTASTKEALSKQGKVKVKLAEDTPVVINGYRLLIQGGVRVEVPQGVYDVLEQAGRV